MSVLFTNPETVKSGARSIGPTWHPAKYKYTDADKLSVSARLPHDLFDWLEAEAESRGVCRSEVVRSALIAAKLKQENKS